MNVSRDGKEKQLFTECHICGLDLFEDFEMVSGLCDICTAKQQAADSWLNLAKKVLYPLQEVK